MLVEDRGEAQGGGGKKRVLQGAGRWERAAAAAVSTQLVLDTGGWVLPAWSLFPTTRIAPTITF